MRVMIGEEPKNTPVAEVDLEGWPTHVLDSKNIFIVYYKTLQDN